MEETPIHGIVYPDGDTTPNVPADLQRLAESTDAALSRVSEAPFIVCGKTAVQSTPAGVLAWGAVTWDAEVWKQGIEHRTDRDADQFLILEDGLYSVNAKIGLTGPDTVGTIVISVNGVDRTNTQVDAAGIRGTNTETWPKPTTITDLNLTAGDVLRVRIRCNKSNNPISSLESFFSLRKSAGFSA